MATNTVVMEALETRIASMAEDHRDGAIRLLQGLVRSPSYSTHEGRHDDARSVVGQLWDELGDHATSRAFDRVSEESENVIEWIDGPGRTLVFGAHTDIVPAGDPRPWLGSGPFGADLGEVAYLGDRSIEITIAGETHRRIIRDKMARTWANRTSTRRSIVYGRGSFDNKGAVVSLALATRVLSGALRDLGLGLGGTLVSAYTADEEQSATGIRRLAVGPEGWLARQHLIDANVPDGFRTDIDAVTLDGSYGWVPVVGHRGALQLTITTHGRASHASTPSLGVNAVEAMGGILVALAGRVDEIGARLDRELDTSLVGKTTIAVGTTIAGGGISAVSRATGEPVVSRSGVNAIPDWCEATLDVRFPPGRGYPTDLEKTYSQVHAVVSDFLESAVRPDGWTYELAPIYDSRTPPVAMASSTDVGSIPIVARLAARASAVLGHEVPIEIAPGGTDATFLVHEARIPSLVELGPAGALSHDTDEYVEVESVIEGARILALLAVDMLGVVE